jgi:hypothetical protein
MEMAKIMSNKTVKSIEERKDIVFFMILYKGKVMGIIG